MAATPQNLTETLLDHVYAVRLGQVPEQDLSLALTRLADSLGVLAAGTRATAMDAVGDLVLSWGGREEASVAGRGQRVPAHEAAFLNAALMRSYDFEPVGALGPDGAQVPAHISGTTVPVALAVAEREGATGEQLLTALIVGDDVAGRLAFGSGFDVYSGQDNTGTVNGIGAVAVAGLLMGLTRDEMRHAWGIVLNQLGGTVGGIFDGASVFKVPMSAAARNAITACDLARAGITGPVDPLTGRFGFVDVFCAEPDLEKMTAGLGERFSGDGTVKAWSCCRAAQPAVDAALRARAAAQRASGGALDPASVTGIRVQVPARTAGGFVGQEYTGGQSPATAGAFSVRYTAACAVAHGTVRPEYMEPADGGPEVARLLEVLDLDGSLEPGGPSAVVELTLADGSVHRGEVGVALGDMHHAPLTEAQIREKFDLNLAHAGVPERADRLWELAHGVAAADVSELAALLRR